MKPRKLRDGVCWIGALDWNRRLFDSLIPLPDGTSYNAYLVERTEHTALLDTVDPAMTRGLIANLEHVPQIDFIVSQHAEAERQQALLRRDAQETVRTTRE